MTGANLQAFSDWDLLDMVEGLRYPSTLERELAKRFRQRLEAEREKNFNHEEKEKQKCLP